MIKGNRILFLGPHTDDIEFGCGGTLSKFIEEGKEIFSVAFSAAERSVPEGYPQDALRVECKKSMDFLRVKAENLLIKDYDVRTFPEHRQSILEEMIVLRKEINPDIVFVPSLHDLHQDHATIATEGLRAFKHATVLAYEVPWNNLCFQMTLFSLLEKKHIENKIAALSFYNSQKGRCYASEEFIWSLANVHGVQAGRQYAEVFEVLRMYV